MDKGNRKKRTVSEKSRQNLLKGRPVGIPNKVTRDMKAFWQHTIERNQPLIDEKLQQLADEDAGRFLTVVLDACEFFVPKISRTEHTGADGGAIPLSVDVSAAALDLQQRIRQISSKNNEVINVEPVSS